MLNDEEAFLLTKKDTIESAAIALSKLGPEPLEEEFTGTYLHSKAKSRKITIKQFIMNAYVVVGVGNIYA